MATTSPDQIYSPDAGQQYALTQDLLAMADSIQAAITGIPRTSFWGWTVLTPESGWSANTGALAPQVRRDGNVVYYRGGFYGGTAYTTASILPSWARPARTSAVWISNTANSASLLRLFNGGAIQPSTDAINAETQTSWTVA